MRPAPRSMRSVTPRHATARREGASYRAPMAGSRLQSRETSTLGLSGARDSREALHADAPRWRLRAPPPLEQGRHAGSHRRRPSGAWDSRRSDHAQARGLRPRAGTGPRADMRCGRSGRRNMRPSRGELGWSHVDGARGNHADSFTHALNPREPCPARSQARPTRSNAQWFHRRGAPRREPRTRPKSCQAPRPIKP